MKIDYEDEAEDTKNFECNEVAAVIFVPENTVGLEIKATVFDNDHIINCTNKYNLQDVITAQKHYLELDPDGDRFMVYKLTEKGKEYLNEIQK